MRARTPTAATARRSTGSAGPASAWNHLGRTRLRSELARSRLLYGGWLRRERRIAEARDQLRIACQMLGAMEMEAFAERARRELLTTRSRGASPRRPASRTASAGPPLASCLYTWRIRAWPAPDDNHRDTAANEQDTKERHTMWPAKYSVSISTLRADALFVSLLQRSDEPSVDQVQLAITAAVRAFGRAGCAERVAKEFGDHSETAVIRMRWARAVTREAFTETAPDPDPRPDADPLLVVGPRLPAGETSDSLGRAA